ncbi:MAG TPA: 5-formyltetrahydrofolate cyclo-ligase [Rhizomicrobium sp.]|nr:5-formyltetrahydrofolate cyclo-ligase [Rhizomicrobium sp.]
MSNANLHGRKENQPADIAAWRKAERARLLEARLAMPLGDFRAASDAVMQMLLARAPRAGTVGCYWPFRREPDCLPFMRAMLRAGVRVALPVVTAREQPLAFRPWTEQTKMEKGPWEILHPAEGAAVTPDLLVVPLLGFDDAGYRLGYGAGYYDRTLASLTPRPRTIAVGFESSRLETIFPQPHDIPMDTILTESGERAIHQAGGA